MKKKLLAIAAALMAVTCSGCGNSSSNSTQTPPAYNGGNNGNNGNAGGNQNNNVQPAPDEYLTYGDYVRKYRDDIVSGAKSVTYQQLARSTDGMMDEYIKITGQITQVMDHIQDGDNYYAGLIYITYQEDDFFAYYDDPVLYYIPKEILNVRPLEDDIVTIWGLSSGLVAYEAVLGNTNTVPSIVAAKVQFEQ